MFSVHRRLKTWKYILFISVLIFFISSNRIGNNLISILTGRSTTHCENVLLFSYMRSGSSVTGNLLRDSPGVFFMFEPLSPLARYSYFTNTSVCEMRNSTCRTKNVSDRIETALTTMINLYACNLRAVPTSVMDKMAQEGKSSKAWADYRACLNGTESRDQKENDIILVDTSTRCLDCLQEACRSADHRVAKVLRLGFSTIKPLLERLPTLKVLYLTRDPRAIINSRIKTKWFPVFKEKPRTVSNNILSLCLKMSTDIMTWKNTNKLFKDRILYTTLNKLTSGLRVMKDVFRFIDKKVTTEVKSQFIQFLYANKANNYTEKWRSELETTDRESVEYHCDFVLENTT